MVKQLYFLSIYCLLFSLSMSGQEAKWHLQFNQIASDKGLSESTNDFVYKDHLGSVWISSLEGLNRFDGRRIKVYKSDAKDSRTLYDSNIQSPFFEDNNRDIWFTTVNSIHTYRRKYDDFNRYFINYKGGIFNNAEYTAFFLEQNRWLWVQASDSLFRFDTKYPPQYKGENSQFMHKLQAARFVVDTFKSGKVKRIIACYWTYRKGIEVINYNEQSQFVDSQTFFTGEKETKLPAFTIKKAIIENDSLVWLSAMVGLVAFNPHKPQAFRVYKIQPNNLAIQSISLLLNSQVLASTTDGQFFIFDKKKEIFSILRPQSKIGETSTPIMPTGANGVYFDRSNYLWLSAHHKGIFFANFNQYAFRKILPAANLALSIEHIIEDKKRRIWVNSYAKQPISLCFTQNGNITTYQNLPPKSKFHATLNGQIWNLSEYGITQKLDTLVQNFQNFKTIPFNLYDAAQSDEYSFLIATNKGLLHFNSKTKEQSFIQGLNYFATNIHKDINNRYWVGSLGKLICYQINEAKLQKKIKEISNIETVSQFHTSIKDPSVLWVATAKGILKINISTLKDTILTEKDGLATNYIQAILEDKHGNLWCSTNQGIFKYNPTTKQSKLYTKRQGLSSDAYNSGAALLSSTGEMWFGGNNGVDVFHPDSIRDIGHAPQSAIVGLKIFDKYWKGETAIEVAEHITLKHNENTLSLELAAMEYTDPENNRFKVALVAKGDTLQWADLGTQNYVTYPNLREGSYTFMLLTANSEGIWNETPKTLVIDIRPPYWRTWWFLSLVALATISLVAYIVYLRLSKVIALQKIRLNLYENLHDDIGSRLTAIVLSVDELVQRTPLKDAKLERIGTISRNIVANMRRLVWATAPENDALSTVVQQMQSDRRVLLPSGTTFTLTMDKSLENLNIGGDKRYQMLSIFNEALTNIAKYADASAVETRIELKDQTVVMTIVDNGKGFDPDAPRADSAMSSGHGLRNMQRRAERIKGEVAITSKLGEGTSVILSFPMNDDTMWTKFKDLLSKSPLK
jgi:ligand-binding sensor domain-containing protein